MFSREDPERVHLNGDGWRKVFPQVRELNEEEQKKFIMEMFK